MDVSKPLSHGLPRLLDRRHLLRMGGGLALAGVSWRALGQTSQPEVIVIGAGVAGIAAARKLAEAGVTYILIEASGRIGGRIWTDSDVFGVPFDMGASRIHFPDAVPFSSLARMAGCDLVRAPEAGRLYLNGREARDTDYEAFAGAVRKAERAIIAAGDAERDIAAARVVPDLGPWSASARFVTGPLLRAMDLDQVSTLEVAHAAERGADEICRQGLGSLVAHLALPLAITLDTPVRGIDLGPRRAVVTTARGNLMARAVIAAVPPSVIAAGVVRIPLLPARTRAAVERIPLGAYEHIAFEWPGVPDSFAPGEIIHFRASGATGYALQARGRGLFSLEVGGTFAQSLAKGTSADARAVLMEAITREFGAEAARGIGRVHATGWSRAPFALGSMSCAQPGAGAMRRAFLETVGGRLVFAGEHAHESLFGTVSGAWLSGERAAGQVMTLLGRKRG